MLIPRTVKSLLSCLLLASIVLAPMVPVHAFTTGMLASLVIGQADFTHAEEVINQTRLNYPFGLGFDASGNLWVADSSNNRVLMFKPPFSNGMAASLVIGQSDFISGSVNGGSETPTQTGFNFPVGLGFDASGNLWVADMYNSRVLMFMPPFSNGKPASVVIGQSDFTQNGQAAAQTMLSWPMGLVFDASGNLWVADYGNSRVLRYSPPFLTHMAANLVIGQVDYTHNGQAGSQIGLSNPEGLGFDVSGNLWVDDTFNNRVLMFQPPFSNGKPATVVIGQVDFTHYGGTGGQTGLSFPGGLGFDFSGNLWVADGTHQRVLMFKPPFSNGMAASQVIGQADFTGYGYATTQTGFFFPMCLRFDASGNLWVADSSNNRVLMFDGSSGLIGFLLQLQAGWNLVSFPVFLSDPRPAQLLKALIQLNDLVVAWGYVAASKSWQSFVPGGGSLTNMVAGQGYWIYLREPVNITVTGYPIWTTAPPPSYSLSAGWNLLGFKPRPIVQNETVGQYLASISDLYDPNNLWVYNNVNKRWVIVDSGTWLTPGEGMWIYMRSAATFLPG